MHETTETPTYRETPSRQAPALHGEPKRSGGRKLLWLVVLVALGAGGWYVWQRTHAAPGGTAAQAGGGGGGGRRGGGGGGGGPVPVTVSTAAREDLPVYLDGLGSVQAYYTVTVTSRVAGEVQKVYFTEGQDVKKGDDLVLIDPRPYEVALAQSKAALVKDQASLRDAKLNADRFAELVKEGVIPEQQADTQKATADEMEGQVESDQANIDSAQLNVTYSHITSPIDGRVGLRLVDPGNIVTANANTAAGGMLVITQLEPITAVFTLPEDVLPQVQQAMRAGGNSLQVLAMSRDEGKQIATGTLLTIDNEIDQTTGTFKAKALFPNHDRALWPNEFVNARLQLYTQKDAIVIPSAAVQNGAKGPFVYAVGQDNTVSVQPVTVSITEGSTDAVTGLSNGEMVVVDGQDRVREGMTVDPHQETRDIGGVTAAAGSTPGPASGDSAAAPGRRGGRSAGGSVNGQAGDPPAGQAGQGNGRGKRAGQGGGQGGDPSANGGKRKKSGSQGTGPVS